MTPTTLYRLHDAANALLYVGIGSNPGRRFEQGHMVTRHLDRLERSA